MSDPVVFICHSSKDAAIAREVVAFLETNGLACWISSRDVEPGQNYQETIVRAIRRAEIVLLLFSEHANRSDEIKKELSLAGTYGVSVIPLRLSDAPPNEALQYELATRQWIDGWPDPSSAFPRLLTSIAEAIAARHATRVLRSPTPRTPSAPLSAAHSVAVDVIDAAEAERLTRLLAPSLGPVARVLVRRAQAQAGSRSALLDALARQIPDATERATFLRAAQAR